MSGHYRMLLGVVLGAGVGLAANALGADNALGAALLFTATNVAQHVGTIFLRLLFLLVIPMLFSAIVIGISGLDLKGLGRVGARTLLYTVVFSLIAVLLGMFLVTVVKPGAGVSDGVRKLALSTNLSNIPKAPSGTAGEMLAAMFPDNPVKAAANGDMLGVILFSVLFGVAVARTDTPGVKQLKDVIQGVYDVTMTLVGWVLKLAPIGVFALLYAMTAKLGLELLRQILTYVLVVLGALAIHLFVVYGFAVKFLAKRDPIQFFKDIRLALATAFATSSSSATLPTALKVAEENLKLPPQVARFVLTAGSAMNQNGTALFEGVTVLFLAQVFGVDLSLPQQFVIMCICVLAGIGTAGIPAGSLPVIAMILGMFGIPPEGIGLILGVDRILDMSRTTLNVAGDLAAATYVARFEERRPEGSG